LKKVASLSPNAPDVDALLETYGEAEATTERERPGARYPEIIAKSIIATGAAHGIEVPDDLAAEIGDSVPEWPAFPDSEEALRRLEQRYRLIILSNVDRQSFAGSSSRLGVEFDAVLTAEDIGSYKPDPRNFEALLAKIADMGIAPDRLLHVAQSLFHDHVPAKATGLATVWIDRRAGKAGAGATPLPGNAPEPDWCFTSLADFADAVEGESSCAPATRA
jgi:putative hydrolase of the HAD superfamily